MAAKRPTPVFWPGFFVERVFSPFSVFGGEFNVFSLSAAMKFSVNLDDCGGEGETQFYSLA